MSQNFPNVAALKSYITQSNSLLVKDLLNDAFLTVIGALESVNMTLLHEINKRSTINHDEIERLTQIVAKLSERVQQLEQRPENARQA